MTVAVDTSVAVPLLVRSHHHHAEVVRWWYGQELTLSGHSLAETYSVLTRLPGDARLSAEDAARLLDARFTTPLALSGSSARKVGRYHEAFGNRLIAIGGHPGFLSRDQFLASLELFQAQVVPVLRRTIPDPPWPGPVASVRRRPAGFPA